MVMDNDEEGIPTGKADPKADPNSWDNRSASATALMKKFEKHMAKMEENERVGIRKTLGMAPVKFQKNYLRTMLGLATPEEAIEAYCYECHNWRETPETIEPCRTSKGINVCILSAYKPKRVKVDKTEEALKQAAIELGVKEPKKRKKG